MCEWRLSCDLYTSQVKSKSKDFVLRCILLNERTTTSTSALLAALKAHICQLVGLAKS